MLAISTLNIVLIVGGAVILIIALIMKKMSS